MLISDLMQRRDNRIKASIQEYADQVDTEIDEALQTARNVSALNSSSQNCKTVHSRSLSCDPSDDAMLKHTVQAAKLDAAKSRHLDPFSSKLESLKSNHHPALTCSQSFSPALPTTSSNTKRRTKRIGVFKTTSLPVTSATNTQTKSSNYITPTQKRVPENYAQINKTSISRTTSVPITQQKHEKVHHRRTLSASTAQNFSFIEEEIYEQPPALPPVTEGVYIATLTRTHTPDPLFNHSKPTNSSTNQLSPPTDLTNQASGIEQVTNQDTRSVDSALPPPLEFSDYSEISESGSERRDSYHEVFKDYLDCDKSGNNNNGGTMSFYSDNYIRSGTLGNKKKVENYLNPISRASPYEADLNRGEKLRQSMMSSASSGISMSYSTESENVNMHGRPLPTPPMVSPRRYFNGSPDLHAQTKHPYNTLPSRLAQRPASPSVQVSQQIDHDDILSRVPWFQPNLSREEVLDHLSKEEIGSFIIRESSTQQGCFALSVKVPKFENPAGLSHYLIYRTETNTNFRIKGLDKEWPNLSALVTHHTIMPELLPCTLKIPLPVRTRRQGSTASRSSDSSSSSSSNHSDKSFGVNKNSDSTDKPATLTKNISLQPTRQIGLV